MFDIIELNGKKVAELREIAGKLGIARTDKLKKQDLVYSILDEQAAQPSKAKSSDADSKKPSRSRRAKTEDKPSKEGSASKSKGRQQKKCRRTARIQGRSQKR